MDAIDFSLVGYGYHHYVFANRHPRLSFSSEQTDTDLLSLAVDRLESNAVSSCQSNLGDPSPLKHRGVMASCLDHDNARRLYADDDASHLSQYPHLQYIAPLWLMGFYPCDTWWSRLPLAMDRKSVPDRHGNHFSSAKSPNSSCHIRSYPDALQ